MYISDITIKDFILNDTFTTLENIVFFDEELVVNKCDVGILFGGISMFERANSAIYLYKHKLISKILITGGKGYLNKDRLNTEAGILNRYLISKGIPSKDIFLESKSRDTLENVYNSLNILSNYYDLASIKLVIITSDFHMRRCFSLLSNYINHLYMFPCKDSVTSIDTWTNSLEGITTIIKEAYLLKCYVDKKIIDDYNIEVLKKVRKF